MLFQNYKNVNGSGLANLFKFHLPPNRKNIYRSATFVIPRIFYELETGCSIEDARKARPGFISATPMPIVYPHVFEGEFRAMLLLSDQFKKCVRES